jgi:hypothetical protein
MFGEARGRRPRTPRALLAAAVGVIVLISTPATAQATSRGPVNPGPDPVTVTVSSRSQVTNTTLTVSFPHGDRSRLSSSLNALLHPGGGGSAGVNPAADDFQDLNCNEHYPFTTSDGKFDYMHGCGASTAPWGFKISAAVQAIVVGEVTESGMTWELNGTMQGSQAPHTEPEDYPFHGTFNPLHDGDYLTYLDYYTFAIEVGGETGRGAITVSGQIHQLASPSGAPNVPIGAMFNSYSDHAGCADWSGGDATNSVVLPDGERAWFFSDTYLNNAAARKSLWYSSGIHNSIVLQNGGSLVRTITGGNTCQEQNQALNFWDRYAKTPAPAPDVSSGGWYWTGDQMLVGGNVVKFYYHGYPTTTAFDIDYPAVATIPASALETASALTVNPVRFACGPARIIWGSALLDWHGSVYVYGWQNSHIYLARTTAAGLTNPGSWQLYDGLSGGSPVWGSCASSPAALAMDGVTASSVADINGTLWLVQFDYTEGQLNAAGPIAAHPAATPWGFDNNSVALYNPPEGLSVHYPYFYQVYEARIQAGLGAPGTVVISYNVNTESVDTGCVSANAHDIGIYRPRFITIPETAFDPELATRQAVRNTPAVRGSGLAAAGAPVPGAPKQHAAGPAPNLRSASPASASAVGIDGTTDWYWTSLGLGCPAIDAPSRPTATVQPDGVVALTWPSVGTDVWYDVYFCDATVADCSRPGTTAPWTDAWSTPQGNLWSPVPAAYIDPVGKTSVGGSDTSGHTFAIYVHSFGAGNAAGGGNSPTISQVVTR